MKHALILALLLCCSGINASAHMQVVADLPEGEAYVKDTLRPNYERIAAIKKWVRVERKEVSDEAICLGDAKLAFHYSEAGLEKIMAKLAGETHETVTEYYFLDGRLSFIHSKRKEFDGDKYEWRGYFKDDTCFRVLGNKGKKLSLAEMKEWLLEDYGYREYACFRAILKHGGVLGSVETAAVMSLEPSQLGEFATPDPDNEEYNFRADPQGKHFHFFSLACAVGDSPWDAFWNYEEHFTATTGNADSLRTQTMQEHGVIRARDGGGNRDSAWSVKGDGIGERVNLRVRTQARMEDKGDDIRFVSLMIVNGNAKDDDAWRNSTRVKTLRLYVGGEPWCDLQLKDTIKPQVFEFPAGKAIYPAKLGKRIAKENGFTNPNDGETPDTPVYETELSFEIIEVHPGDGEDTSLTGIALDVSGGIY